MPSCFVLCALCFVLCALCLVLRHSMALQKTPSPFKGWGEGLDILS